MNDTPTEHPGNSITQEVPMDISRWLFELVKPYVKDRILEINSGNGNIASQFITEKITLRLSDADRNFREILKQRFEGSPFIKGIYRIDLEREDFEIKHEAFLSGFDTILSLNIRERYLNDSKIINNAKLLLKDGGRLIIIIPPRIALYNELDQSFEEWQQLNRNYIKSALGRNCHIHKIWPFAIYNSAKFEISKNQEDNEPYTTGLKSHYHKEIPVFQIQDESSSYKSGLFIIAMAKKIIEP